MKVNQKIHQSGPLATFLGVGGLVIFAGVSPFAPVFGAILIVLICLSYFFYCDGYRDGSAETIAKINQESLNYYNNLLKQVVEKDATNKE